MDRCARWPGWWWNRSMRPEIGIRFILLLLLGMINSLRFSTMNNLTLKDLPDELASAGNSLLSMVMQLSMSLGVTLVGYLLSLHVRTAMASGDALHDAFMQTYLWLGLVLAAPALVFMRLPRRS